MNGFTNQRQRERVCRVVGSWLLASGCGFEPMIEFGPSIDARNSSRTRTRPDGAPLSKGQLATLRIMLDLWSAGLGRCLVSEMVNMDERTFGAIALLMVALNSNGVNQWLDVQEILSTTDQGVIKTTTRKGLR